MRFPKIQCIQQKRNSTHILNLKSLIKEKLVRFQIQDYISPGDSIGLTASSRGIKNQAIILKTIVKFLKNLKTQPFIIPAMGSHAGGTATGQKRLLHNYGITEENIGCPIKATMKVVEIAKSEFGDPLYIDKYAASADKIIIINKIKTHSKFYGDVESGLTKMCLMGLGKRKGAKLYHQIIAQHSWDEISKSFRKSILQNVPIICGIGVIQNSYNEIAEIHILSPEEFETKEPQLLKRYKEIQMGIPFKEIDLLIVDEMGKNIFGTGMDTNITGRKLNSEMNVQWLFVRDLTEETHGNAQGIGLADFTTKRVIDKIDISQTYVNALTAFRTDSAKLPIHFPTDKDVLKEILKLASFKEPSEFRLVWIKNTLELDRLLVSEYFFDKVASRDDLTIIEKPESLSFDKYGFLINSTNYW
ncbi:MAG: DUF2088 domain-containing protein [Promethearchaeota archaeon]|nr:MAG: DUF2088 domain-containing protein [Candidatus Lokiarchaeota archaeon]